MDEIMNSIKELRKTLESKIDSCITKEKAEKMVSDIVNTLHPQERKAVLPSTPDELLERFAAFGASQKNVKEEKWTSAYGRKFGNMRNFLLAAKDRHSFVEDGKSVLAESGVTGGGYLVPTDFTANVARIIEDISPIMKIANVIPMGAWKRQMPKQMSSLNVGWVAENANRPVANPAFGQIEQVAKVLATVIKCTDELIRDSAINLTEFLSQLVAEAMALEIERVALVGNTEDGDPFNGVYNTSGVEMVNMKGADVTFDDIANLIFTLSDAKAAGSVLALALYGYLKDAKKRAALVTRFLPQLELGDIVKVSYLSSGGNILEGIFMRIEGIELDMENWRTRLDLCEVL